MFLFENFEIMIKLKIVFFFLINSKFEFFELEF